MVGRGGELRKVDRSAAEAGSGAPVVGEEESVARWDDDGGFEPGPEDEGPPSWAGKGGGASRPGERGQT